MSKQKEFDQLIPFSDSDKWGYKDQTTGEIVIPAKYSMAQSFDDDMDPVRLAGKQGFIDKTGKEVIPLIYNHVGLFGVGKHMFDQTKAEIILTLT